FFFFSSRRRHTRSDRDWSSDVCSSDLAQGVAGHGSMLAGDASECSMRVELSRLTRAAGATVVEINPNATPLSSTADYVLRGAAGAVPPALISGMSRASRGGRSA